MSLWVAPELADPVGPLEVGEHQDVEELGAGSGAESVEPLAQDSFELLEVHERTLAPERDGSVAKS